MVLITKQKGNCFPRFTLVKGLYALNVVFSLAFIYAIFNIFEINDIHVDTTRTVGDVSNQLMSNISLKTETTTSSSLSSPSSAATVSYKTPIAYGTRGGGDKTHEYVCNAILEGFRHIVTSSHHMNHEESGVGRGWKLAVSKNNTIRRSDLFLQTMFVPWSNKQDFKAQEGDPPGKESPSVEDQVHITIQQSLTNLQVDYIDAVLFHNFRGHITRYDHMLRAWKVLEDYVAKGIIRFLGLSSVHDQQYLNNLFNESKVPPVIIQNRFHKNRKFDSPLHSFFTQHKDVQVQRFWVLTGNGGGMSKSDAIAKQKNLTKQQLQLAFVMSLGGSEDQGGRTYNTALVGTHSIQHLQDDLYVANHYKKIFEDTNKQDNELIQIASHLGMKYPLPM